MILISDNINSFFFYFRELHIITRFNYDDIWNALISTFCIFVNEEWHLFVIDYAFTKGGIYIIYFVIVIIFFQILLMKMFIALLINNFCRSAHLLKKKNEKKKYYGIKVKIFHWMEILKSYFAKDPTIRNSGKLDFSLSSNIKCENFASNSLSLNRNDQNDGVIEYEPKRIFFKFFSFRLHKFNLFCKSVSQNIWFEYFMLFIIILSTLAASSKSPFQAKESNLNLSMHYIEVFCTILFCIEAIIKIGAQGFFTGKKSYLFNQINIIDFVMIWVDIASFIGKFDNLVSSIRILRLSFVGPYKKHLFIVLKTFFGSIMSLFKLGFIFLIITVVYAIFGVVCLHHTFYECVNTRSNFTINTRTDCFDNGGDWINYDLNFDSLGNALVLLFIVAGTENWIPLL